MNPLTNRSQWRDFKMGVMFSLFLVNTCAAVFCTSWRSCTVCTERSNFD